MAWAKVEKWLQSILKNKQLSENGNILLPQVLPEGELHARAGSL